MVIDTSAVVAILEHEPERETFVAAIESADMRCMSVANFVELSITAQRRRGAAAVGMVEVFLSSAGIELVAVDIAQGQAASTAFSRFGKGRHRAGLNYGDCFAYALAKIRGEPLLCKGNDFVHTDLALVTVP